MPSNKSGMKFGIIYSKLGNQFFFISNLTEWHFSCRKKYNEEWLKQTGHLNKKEKKAIEEFKTIIKNYGFESKSDKNVYLGIPFIIPPSSRVWKKVKNWVKKDDYKKLKKIFEIFKPRFEKIWAVSSKQLKETKQILRKKLENKKTNEILEVFSNLYKNKEEIGETLEIYLFAAPTKSGMGGGANLGPGRITIESSKVGKEELPRLLSMIFHEIAHLFERKYFRPLLKKWVDNLDKKETEKIKKTKVYQEIQRLETILNEIIVSSLLPEGYLTERFFKIKVKNRIRNYFRDNFKSDIKSLPQKHRNLKNLRSYNAYYLYDLIKKYIKEKKPFNEYYIQEAYKLLKKFEGLK